MPPTNNTSSTNDLVSLDRMAPALAAALGDDRWLGAGAKLISGGKSNLTFILACDAGELVLRRPPTGDLLPSAHDMAREARVQRALSGSGVPVAEVVLSDDGALLGVPCYVMRKVTGHVVRNTLPAGYASSAAAREAMAWAFVDTLAAIHSVDAVMVGLGDFGRAEGFMERQVRRWGAQWESSRIDEVAEVTELGRRLAARVPAPQPGAVVHGDYRIDNVIFDAQDEGRVRAVLDWELSTLGDPLADLGMLMLFWREAGEPPIELIPGVTHLSGFPSRAGVVERYAAASDLDLSALSFYEAFAHYKFAVIAQGVAARSRTGAMAGQSFGDLDGQVRQLAASGLTRI